MSGVGKRPLLAHTHTARSRAVTPVLLHPHA